MKRPVILTLLALASSLTASPSIDLSGEWRFGLDPQDSGIAAPKEKAALSDSVRLPGSITSQGFGEAPSMKTEWTGDGWRYPEMFKEWQADGNFKFPFFLQPPKVYVGPAWYQRDFEWSGGPALLHLERVHWQSTVWLDGKMIGRDDSLGTPHEFDLGDLPAGKHTITLRIDNRLTSGNPIWDWAGTADRNGMFPPKDAAA